MRALLASRGLERAASAAPRWTPQTAVTQRELRCLCYARLCYAALRPVTLAELDRRKACIHSVNETLTRLITGELNTKRLKNDYTYIYLRTYLSPEK